MKQGRALSSEEVNVTDHALIRWIERVLGVDLQRHRDHIASLTRDAIDLGATSVQVDGYLYVIDPTSRAIVTIYTHEQRKNRHAHLLVTMGKKERHGARILQRD